MTPPIVVAHVGKQFRVHQPDRPWTIQEAVARGLRRSAPPQSFWALRDVSFSVGAGRTVGLVGANGSGKSTMLRLIGGVGRPDTGTIHARGRVGALLDLGAGFHTELTGRENTIVTGILNGLTRREVLERMDAIIAFAEIDRAMDNPIRTFSTGMRMRLAFAIAVHTDPEILIIDEVLAVGDVAFQRKCLDRIAAFKAAGCSIILVSHEAGVVTELCDEAVWLKSGRLMSEGAARDVVHDYLKHMAADRASALATPHGGDPSGKSTIKATQEVQLLNVHLCDVDGSRVSRIRSGSPLRIEIEYLALRPVKGPIFQVRVAREDGLIYLDLNTEWTPLRDALVEGPGRVTAWLDRVDVNSGSYNISVGCNSSDWTHLYEYRKDICRLQVQGDDTPETVMNTPCRWEMIEG